MYSKIIYLLHRIRFFMSFLTCFTGNRYEDVDVEIDPEPTSPTLPPSPSPPSPSPFLTTIPIPSPIPTKPSSPSSPPPPIIIKPTKTQISYTQCPHTTTRFLPNEPHAPNPLIAGLPLPSLCPACKTRSRLPPHGLWVFDISEEAARVLNQRIEEKRMSRVVNLRVLRIGGDDEGGKR